MIKRFPSVKWDFLIIDEAHNLRNVFHGTKRAKNLYDLTRGIPKVLLTATPLQNALSDLHGLVSFIDPRIFGSERIFNRRFVEGGDYDELKQELLPVLYRTLRRDVGKYMAFSKRTCITVDFHLSPEEKELYDGLIIKKEYAPGSRKAHSVDKSGCSVEEFAALCERLLECIETADSLDGYCDDSSEELIIYHKYGRIQTMDRGLGNDDVRIGEVINHFLANYLSD